VKKYHLYIRSLYKNILKKDIFQNKLIILIKKSYLIFDIQWFNISPKKIKDILKKVTNTFKN